MHLNLIINLFFLLLLTFHASQILSTPHSISFKSPNLYPNSLAYDPIAQHFLLGSPLQPHIYSLSDAGILQTLITLPQNSSTLSISINARCHTLLVLLRSPHHHYLASYQLPALRRVYLTDLPSSPSSVASDDEGNAYVSGGSILKFDANGSALAFSERSPRLDGIAYVSKGYLLGIQSETGSLYKVRGDGTSIRVPLSEDLVGGIGISVRRDGVVVVVSQAMLWYLKSDDSWGQGAVYDKTVLEREGLVSSVVVGDEDRAYVLYGYLEEEEELGREWFRVEEVRAERESEDEKIWVYVLIGFGLAYFLFWRFQMSQLVKNMNKKTA